MLELLYTTFALLTLFQLKHFICDFPLQGRYMLRKMDKEGWEVPLLAHATVHGIGTFTIVLSVTILLGVWLFNAIQFALALACVDVVLHFLVDRIKASPNLGGKHKPTESRFWINLGLDQLAHHLINYCFIAVVLLYLYQNKELPC